MNPERGKSIVDMLPDLLLAVGIFSLGVSILSLIGYMVFGSKARHVLVVMSVSFTAGALALNSRVFLDNFPK